MQVLSTGQRPGALARAQEHWERSLLQHVGRYFGFTLEPREEGGISVPMFAIRSRLRTQWLKTLVVIVTHHGEHYISSVTDVLRERAYLRLIHAPFVPFLPKTDFSNISRDGLYLLSGRHTQRIRPARRLIGSTLPALPSS